MKNKLSMNSSNRCETILERLKQLKIARKEELKALQEESRISVESFDTTRNTEDFSSTSHNNLSKLALLENELVSVGNQHFVSKIHEIPTKSSFLGKITEQVIAPPDRPKFPFLRKGDGTAKYGNKKLKGFTKRKLSKNNVIHKTKKKDDDKSKNLQAFEELEDLVGHDSFQSTAPHVMNLLDINETISSTPIPLKREARKVNLIERYSKSNEEKCLSSKTTELEPSNPGEKSVGTGEHSNCRDIGSRVKFTSGLEVLEYEDPCEITSVDDSDIFNNSDLEVLKAKGMCYNIFPKVVDDQTLSVKPNIPAADSTLDRIYIDNKNILPEKMLLLSKIQCLDKEIKVFRSKNKKLDEDLNLFKEKSEELQKQKGLLELEKKKHAKAKEEFLQYALAKQDFHDNSENISTEAIMQLNLDISKQLNNLHRKIESIQAENCELKTMITSYQDKQNQREQNPLCHKDSPSVSERSEIYSSSQKKIVVSQQPVKRPSNIARQVPIIDEVRKSSKVILSPLQPINFCDDIGRREMKVVECPTKMISSTENQSSVEQLSAAHKMVHSSQSCGKNYDILPLGVLENIFPDRTELTYPNGDLRIKYHDRSVYKFFSEEVVETSYPDGKREVEFPNGQKEVYFADGSYQVIFSNNASVSVYKDGSEKTVAADGTVTHTNKSGKKVVHYPNGQKEIFEDDCAYRIWPDGTTKVVHKDGTQETKYPNGKVRIKDTLGNISISAQNKDN